ncbi:MAG: hypothetical protein RBS39_08885 [Phycisphaerales bacterium]|nr:hypothetical protein [Phycisphaerales bacterium]
MANAGVRTNAGAAVQIHGGSGDLDWSRVVSVGDRLRGELLGVFEQVPREGAGVSALARTLGVDRSLCHRVLAALRPEHSGEEVLRRMPGVDGLEQVVRAALRMSGRGEASSPALAAVEEFRRLIWDAGGSHAKLSRWVQDASSRSVSVVGEEPGKTNEDARSRRSIMEGASRILGYSVDAVTMVAATRPMPSRPDCVEGGTISALAGLRSRAARVVVVSRAVQLRPGAQDMTTGVSSRPLGERIDEGEGLIRSLSTQPLPLAACEDEDGTLRQVVEANTGGAAGVDVVTARQWSGMPHPAHDQERFWAQSCSVQRPARRLVFDVYMHRSMAMVSLPSITPMLWRPNLRGNPLKHWDRRVGSPPTLELLGKGIANAASPAWERHAEMTRELFTQLAWNPDDFVGYRCDVDYPVWSAAYIMVFEFGNED